MNRPSVERNLGLMLSAITVGPASVALFMILSADAQTAYTILIKGEILSSDKFYLLLPRSLFSGILLFGAPIAFAWWLIFTLAADLREKYTYTDCLMSAISVSALVEVVLESKTCTSALEIRVPVPVSVLLLAAFACIAAFASFSIWRLGCRVLQSTLSSER